MFENSALKCKVSFLFNLLKIPRLKALALCIFDSLHHLGNDGIPFSLKFVAVSCSPFSSLPGSRNVQCPCENLSARALTFSEFEIQFSSFPFIVQSMSLNTGMKMIRSPNCSGSILRSCRSFWICWRIGNDVNPGKIFHSNSIGSASMPSNSP